MANLYIQRFLQLEDKKRNKQLKHKKEIDYLYQHCESVSNGEDG